LSDELKGDVRLEITRLMKQLMDSAALVHIPPIQSPRKKIKTALLGEEGDDDPCDDCEEEVRQYFMEKVVPRNMNPLQWWKMNELRFKNLFRVARSILCVPATSTASEWLFSTAGLTVTNLRSCLKPENADGFVFLK